MIRAEYRQIMAINDGSSLKGLMAAIEVIKAECGAAPYPGKRMGEVFFEHKYDYCAEKYFIVAVCHIKDKDYE